MILKPPRPLGEKSKTEKTPIINKIASTPVVKKERKKISLNLTFLQNFKYKHLITPILIGIAMVASLSFLIYQLTLLPTKDAKRISDTFLTRIEKGDIQGAYQLTTASYKSINTLKEFRSALEDFEPIDLSKNKVTKRNLVTVKDMSKSAIIMYKQDNYEIEVILFIEEDDWEVLSFKVLPL
ncbi:hypothetical protein A2436_00405 [candidate division WS6 bacterium RIFOXYC1_FULL_33_9]|nr:MAG: hypothetical protein A2369_01720 [candidate division WS6 bacterium RIFOXYB1_FULL_33_15]OGC37637.1 MAG: hypothetical protein A2436_00405 [candidate division WS6 bacterium RIFOXYC1_FULL_33_9]